MGGNVLNRSPDGSFNPQHVTRVIDWLFHKKVKSMSSIDNAVIPIPTCPRKESEPPFTQTATADKHKTSLAHRRPVAAEKKQGETTPSDVQFAFIRHRNRHAVAKRQAVLDLLGELVTSFAGIPWRDHRAESIIDYHFVFTLRLFLTDVDPDIRAMVLRVLRHTCLSDRVLQLYSDLFVPELAVAHLQRGRTVHNDMVQALRGSPNDQPAMWNIQERVAALKLIRFWLALTVSQKTVVPIPMCFFLALVAVGAPAPACSTPEQQCAMFKSKNIDPLRFSCLETLRDMALRLSFPLFRRFAAAGGVTVLIDTVTDAVAFEVDPALCSTLIVVISRLLGDNRLKQPIHETAVIPLLRSPERHALPLTLVVYADGCLTQYQWRSWWFLECSSLCAALVDALRTSNIIDCGRLRLATWGKAVYRNIGMSNGHKREQQQKRGELSVAYQGIRKLRWRAATTAFFALCRTIPGLLAVLSHPYGVRSIVKLLWKPLHTETRLDLVIFFTRLLFMVLTFDGRPIQHHEDLFCLFYTRYMRSYLAKELNGPLELVIPNRRRHSSNQGNPSCSPLTRKETSEGPQHESSLTETSSAPISFSNPQGDVVSASGKNAATPIPPSPFEASGRSQEDAAGESTGHMETHHFARPFLSSPSQRNMLAYIEQKMNFGVTSVKQAFLAKSSGPQALGIINTEAFNEHSSRAEENTSKPTRDSTTSSFEQFTLDKSSSDPSGQSSATWGEDDASQWYYSDVDAKGPHDVETSGAHDQRPTWTTPCGSTDYKGEQHRPDNCNFTSNSRWMAVCKRTSLPYRDASLVLNSVFRAFLPTDSNMDDIHWWPVHGPASNLELPLMLPLVTSCHAESQASIGVGSIAPGELQPPSGSNDSISASCTLPKCKQYYAQSTGSTSNQPSSAATQQRSFTRYWTSGSDEEDVTLQDDPSSPNVRPLTRCRSISRTPWKANSQNEHCRTARDPARIALSNCTASSLNALTNPEPIGFTPLELTLVSGFGYGTSVDMRDIHGLLLLRTLLHEELHLALASILIELQGTVSGYEDILKSVIHDLAVDQFDAHSGDVKHNGPDSPTTLLLCSAQLLAVMLCAASFIFPNYRSPSPPRSVCIGSHPNSSATTVLPATQQPQGMPGPSASCQQPYSIDYPFASVAPAKRAGAPYTMAVRNNTVLRLPCEAGERKATRFVPGQPFHPAQLKMSSPHVWDIASCSRRDDNERLNSLAVESLEYLQQSLEEDEDVGNNLSADLPVKAAQHRETLEDAVPLVQAQKLLHYFFQFVSLNFLTRDKHGHETDRLFNRSPHRASRLLRSPFSQKSQPPPSQIHRASTSPSSLHLSTRSAPSPLRSPIAPEYPLSVALQVRQLKCILSYSRFYTGHTVHKEIYTHLHTLRLAQVLIPFPAASKATSSEAILDAYIYATGVITSVTRAWPKGTVDASLTFRPKLEGEACRGPNNGLAIPDAASSPASGFSASRMGPRLHDDDTPPTAVATPAETTTTAVTCSSVNSSCSLQQPSLEVHSVVSEDQSMFGDVSLWNWEVIHQILGELIHPLLQQFVVSRLSKQFLATLTNFFLPASRMFSVQLWNTDVLHWVLGATHLMCVLCFVDEPALLPQLARPITTTIEASASIFATHQTMLQGKEKPLESPHAVASPQPETLKQEIIALRRAFVNDVVYYLRLEIKYAESGLTTFRCATDHLILNTNVFRAEPLFHSLASWKRLLLRQSCRKRRIKQRCRSAGKLSAQRLRGEATAVPASFSRPPIVKRARKPACCNQAISPGLTPTPFVSDTASSEAGVCRPARGRPNRARQRFSTLARPEDDATQRFRRPRLHTTPSDPSFGTRSPPSCRESRRLQGRKADTSTSNASKRCLLARNVPEADERRVFDEVNTRDSLVREYGTLIGTISFTRSGMLTLLEANFFEVLAQLIRLRCRDDLVLLFLKQLCMHYLPCRGVLETAIVYGSTYLRFGLLNQYTLIGSGGGIDMPLSEAPLFNITCDYASSTAADPGEAAAASLRPSSKTNKQAVPKLDLSNLCPLASATSQKMRESNERCDENKRRAQTLSTFCDFCPFYREQNAASLANVECPAATLPRNENNRRDGQTPQQRNTGDCYADGGTGFKSAAGENEAYTADCLAAQNAQWFWVMTWALYLVFAVKPPLAELEAAVQRHYEEADWQRTKTTRCEDTASRLRNEFSSAHERTQQFNDAFEPWWTSEPAAYADPGQLVKPAPVPEFIANVAVNLVTTLCKVGGAPVIDAVLLHYLPSEEGIALPQMRCIPFVRPHLETLERSSQGSLLRPTVLRRRAHSCCGSHIQRWSALRDWPSCLKLQLLNTEKGTQHLIETGWLADQLRLYCVYSHSGWGWPAAAPLTRNAVSSRAQGQHVTPSCRAVSSVTAGDESSALPRFQDGVLQLTIGEPHQTQDVSNIVTPSRPYNSEMHKGDNPRFGPQCASVEAHLLRGPPGRQQAEPKTQQWVKPHYAYVALIDGLAKMTFWDTPTPSDNSDFPSTTTSTQIIKKTETQPSNDSRHLLPLRHFVIPDPYRYHFYCRNGLEKECMLPVCNKSTASTPVSCSPCVDAVLTPSFDTTNGCYTIHADDEEEQQMLGAAIERSATWSALKGAVQQQHQRTPYEFLTYIPFFFVVQLLTRSSTPLKGGQPERQEHVFDAFVIRCLDRRLHQCIADCSVSQGISPSSWVPPLFLAPGLTLSPVTHSAHRLQGIADFNGNASSFKLLALANFTLSSTSTLRTCVRVGNSYVTNDGNLSDDPEKAFWSTVDTTMILDAQFQMLARQLRGTAPASVTSAPNDQYTNQCPLAADRSYPVTLDISGFVWTFCVHIQQGTRRSSNLTGTRDPHVDTAVSHNDFNVTSIHLIQLETALDAVHKLTPRNLERDLASRAQRNACTGSALHRTMVVAPTATTKPPPNLLTYIALTTTGLEFLQTSGFFDSLYNELYPDNAIKSYTPQMERHKPAMLLRSLSWSVGHLLSSEPGVLYLSSKTTLLARLIQMAYGDPNISLRGTYLYALGLIPITMRTKALLNSLGWDLVARGPSHDQFFRFLAGRLPLHSSLPWTVPKPTTETNVASETPAEELSTSQKPAFHTVLRPTMCRTSDQGMGIPCDENLATRLSRLAASTHTTDVVWRTGKDGKRSILLKCHDIELPQNVVAGFDLFNLIFATPFRSTDLAMFGLSVLYHQHLGSPSPVKNNQAPPLWMKGMYNAHVHLPFLYTQQQLSNCLDRKQRDPLGSEPLLTRHSCNPAHSTSLLIEACISSNYIAYLMVPQVTDNPCKENATATPSDRFYDGEKRRSCNYRKGPVRTHIKLNDCAATDVTPTCDASVVPSPSRQQPKPRVPQGTLSQTTDLVVAPAVPADNKNEQRLLPVLGDWRRRRPDVVTTTSDMNSNSTTSPLFPVHHSGFFQPISYSSTTAEHRRDAAWTYDTHDVETLSCKKRNAFQKNKRSGTAGLYVKDFDTDAKMQPFLGSHPSSNGVSEKAAHTTGGMIPSEMYLCNGGYGDLSASDLSDGFDIDPTLLGPKKEQNYYDKFPSTRMADGPAAHNDSVQSIKTRSAADNTVNGKIAFTDVPPCQNNSRAIIDSRAPVSNNILSAVGTVQKGTELFPTANLSSETLRTCTKIPLFQQYTEKHKEVLAKIAKLMNNVAVHTENLITWLENSRNSEPYLFRSVELWWRVQMLFRIYRFPAHHRAFVLSFFSETFNSLDAWFYLDLITQYVKWQCTVPSDDKST